MDIKPCPFCGSDDVGLTTTYTLFGEETKYIVVCNICGSQTRKSRRKDLALDIWNSRAGEEDLVNRIALRDALYDADAITFRGLAILNTFPAACEKGDGT